MSNVFEASPARLRACLKDDCDIALMLTGARAYAQTCSNEVVRGSPVKPQDKAFQRHLRLSIASSGEERFYIVYLDKFDRFLGERCLAMGNKDSVLVPLRPLIQRAFDQNAYSVIIAHNHPSGDAQPSANDVQSTDTMSRLFDMLEIRLMDHLIVGGHNIFSMRNGDYLK